MSSASRLTNDKLMIPGKFAEQLPAYVINALVNALIRIKIAKSDFL